MVLKLLDGFKRTQMSPTWAMSKALSELMARHGQTLPAPAKPTSTSMR
jgi:hypothetical protein